ncbi:hypothetical protein EQH57_0156 [Dictyocoela roeselum]|nr:hypothetical protein EQH57_0156 [Dictyocoela roeselum]
MSETSNEFLDKLLRLKCNKMTAYKYQNKLHSIKQKDFLTIRAYIRQIEDKVERLALCLGWSDSIKSEKMQEIFYCGLDESVKFELTKLPNRDHQSITLTLVEMEAFLIEKFHRKKESHRENYEEHNYDNRNYKGTSNGPKLKRGTICNKFCTYHRTNTHNTSECRTIRKQRANVGKPKAHNNDKTLSINEIRPQPRTIEIPMKIEGNLYDTLIDTGSVENYLPANTAAELKINTSELATPKFTEVANGSLMKIRESADLKFNLFNDDDNTYTSSFHILPNSKG